MKRFLIIMWTLSGCDTKQSIESDDGRVDSGDPIVQDSGDQQEEEEEDTGPPENVPDEKIRPEGVISFPTGRVFDPKIDGSSLQFSATVTNPSACEVWLKAGNGIGQQWVHEDLGEALSWAGLDSDGRFFDTGPVTLSIDADCGSGVETIVESQAFIVRLGLSSLDFHDGDTDGNVDVAFHKRNLFEVEYSPVGERPEYKRQAAGTLNADLDQDNGRPRAIVTPWADPDVPPWIDGEVAAHNVPAAYIASEPIDVTLTLGSDAVSQARSIRIDALGPDPESAPQLRLLLNGIPVADDPIQLGEATRVSLDPASSSMGKEVRTLTWSFEAEMDDEWHAVPGVIQTQHVIYTLAGEPALLDGTSEGKSPAMPWIGVLEDTATVMEGVPATTTNVLDALRDYLFEHEYIVYDPGAGDYTDFEGPYIYWSEITAQISSFLDRRSGLNLYCHSMSCTLSALAGSHGVFAEQLVLGVNFYTNQTRAAGTEDWRRWSFNSHSVVSPDDGGTIWDSSIAMDGDDEPDEDPIEEIMPSGMDGDEYMWRLTYDEIEIVNQGLCYIE